MTTRILETTLQTAKDLHHAGLIGIRTMRELGALCLKPVTSMSAAQIRQLCRRNGLSQKAFAAYLNTSPSTVRKMGAGPADAEWSVIEAPDPDRPEGTGRAWLIRNRATVMSRVSISLDRNGWGQIVEGLEARRASWDVTARYLEGEEVDQAIEECREAEEARALVATYDRLIEELCSQLRA